MQCSMRKLRRESTVAPGHDAPPQDPVERKRKGGSKETESGWVQNTRTKEEERVRRVFKLEEVWLRCGPAPETVLDGFKNLKLD